MLGHAKHSLKLSVKFNVKYFPYQMVEHRVSFSQIIHIQTKYTV